MTFEERIDKAQKVIDLALKCEVHAFLLITIGCLVSFKQHELGTGMVMTGLGIFRGKS